MTELRDLFVSLQSEIALGVLVLGRTAGLFLLGPIFGSPIVPARARAAIAIALALAVAPVTAPAPPGLADGSVLPFLVALGVEIMIGSLMGLVTQFVFAGAQMGGQLAGVQMGLGMSNLVDPQTQDRVTTLAQWQNLMAVLLFLTLDGHHLMIGALHQSFQLLPAGGQGIGGNGILLALTLAKSIFVIALKIAAPVLVLVLMVNGAMGALTKMIPQLNVMVVGFGVNIAAGFFILGVSQPFALRFLEGAFVDLGPGLESLIVSME